MRTLPRLAAVVLLVLAACPKRVTVDGREMAAEAAAAEASRELARTRAETARLPPAAAAERFEALAARYENVPVAAEALFEAAQRWRTAGRNRRTQQALSTLLTRYPLSPRATRAKYLLALADAEAGRHKDALSTLSSVYERLPDSERLEAAQAAARSAEAARLWPQAARWRGEAARLSGGEVRLRELSKAIDHVLARLGQEDLLRLKEQLPDDSPLLPAVELKLARLQPATAPRAEAERVAQPFRPGERALGLVVPLSGKQKQWGEALVQGATLALEGSGVAVIAKDSRGEADGAQAAVEELARDPSVVAALGGLVTGEATRAASAAQAQGLPFVSLARNDGVTAAGPFVFQNMLTARAQARALAELAMGRRGLRRFALLWPQIPYGDELAHAFWDELDARGGEVRAAESYAHDRTTFAPLVRGILGKGPEERSRRHGALESSRGAPAVDFDAVFIPDFATQVALLTPALAVEDVYTETCDPREAERVRRATGRADQRPVQLLGANGWDDPSLVDKAGKYVECAIFVDGFFAASSRPATRAFVNAFQLKYGHPPSILEASAYDTARLVRAVLEGGASSRDGVRERLAARKGFPGATGDLSFDERREVTKQLFYLTVERGAVRELAPEELGPAPAGS